MAVLKKLEYFISSTSENTTQDAIDRIKAELNRKQALASNKTSSGEFKNLYFAGFFDPRSLKQFLIFANETKTSGGLSDTLYDLSQSVTDANLISLVQTSVPLQNAIKNIVETMDLVTQQDLEDAAIGAIDLTSYAKKEDVATAIDEAINGDGVTMEFINSLGANTQP